jgi:hypothetical protein
MQSTLHPGCAARCRSAILQLHKKTLGEAHQPHHVHIPSKHTTKSLVIIKFAPQICQSAWVAMRFEGMKQRPILLLSNGLTLTDNIKFRSLVTCIYSL